ncbi:MAG TPA: Xaa-Pro peptidase family protein [Candidatus Nanoarchaeia archaeon]|nr:Xaa-Pro peptidase family protein [Candidatus Nanoarchaeia archaeon]
MKLAAFQRHLERERIGAAVFLNLSPRQQDWAIEYLTGIDDLEYGALVVTSTSATLLATGFEYERFKKNPSISVKKGERDLLKQVSDAMKRHRTIGINSGALNHESAEHLKRATKKNLISISKTLLELRMTKTSEEISRIKKATKLTDTIFASCISNFKKFKTEEDVDRYLRAECARHDVEPAYDPIVASGPNASFPHHRPKGKLHKGFCVIDFGVKYKGYCADMTRTIFLGTPNTSERELYSLVLNVQRQGVLFLIPGARFVDVDAMLRESLGVHQKNFIHSFGHSLGMDVHDPLPVRSRDLRFVRDMIFTMEPGLYFAGKLGIRIEDDVVVGKKPVILNKTPHHLVCITRR